MSSSTTLTTLSIWFLFLTLSISFVTKTTMAAEEKNIYIIFTGAPKGQNLKQFFIKILTPAVGSPKDAEKAIVDAYGAVGGFAAFVTREQAIKVKRQPGVQAVLQDEGPVGPPPNNP